MLVFVSATLLDLSLIWMIAFAGQNGSDTVEVMCWPHGRAERRYTGATHVDVTDLMELEARAIKVRFTEHAMGIRGLAYGAYPRAGCVLCCLRHGLNV